MESFVFSFMFLNKYVSAIVVQENAAMMFCC